MRAILLALLFTGCEAISRGEETICVGLCKRTEVETKASVDPCLMPDAQPQDTATRH